MLFSPRKLFFIGFLIISKYCQPDKGYTFEDIEVDEKELIKNVKIIEGDAFFNDSTLASLGNIQKIGGLAYFDNSRITNLGNLQTSMGDANFVNSKIKTLN